MSGSNRTSQPGVYGTRGIGSPSNAPGARENGVSWTLRTTNTSLWIFGGAGYGNTTTLGSLNDLWSYELVLESITTSPMTTSPLTTSPITTSPLSTGSLTTSDATTSPITTTSEQSSSLTSGTPVTSGGFITTESEESSSNAVTVILLVVIANFLIS